MNTLDYIRSETAQQVEFGFFIDQTVHIFCRAYLYSSFFRQARLITKFDIGKVEQAMVLGIGVQILDNYPTPIQKAINLLLLAKCITDLLENYRHISSNCMDLWDTLIQKYPDFSDLKHSPCSIPYNSPSLTKKINIKAKKVFCYFANCGDKLFILIISCHKASMRLFDISLVFNKDARARIETCTEFVLECDHYQKQLEENVTRLYEELEYQAEKIDHYFKWTNQPINTQLFIQTIQKEISIDSALVYDGIKKVKNTIFNPNALAPLEFDIRTGKSLLTQSDHIEPFWKGETTIKPPTSIPIDHQKPSMTQKFVKIVLSPKKMGKSYHFLENLSLASSHFCKKDNCVDLSQSQNLELPSLS